MASRDAVADALSNDALEDGVTTTETVLDKLGGEVSVTAEAVCAAVENPLLVDVICAESKPDTDETGDGSALELVKAVAAALALFSLIVDRAL